jgi:hypothetical protein
VAYEWARCLVRDLTERATVKVQVIGRRTSFVGGVEKFASVDRSFAIDSSAWNTDPLLLATPAGTVDLRTGNLRPADPADKINQITAVGPANRADCPGWLAFLEEATGADYSLIDYLQRWCGYCLTGDISGMLNRILSFKGDDHAKWRKPSMSGKVPIELVPRLRALYRKRPGQPTSEDILSRKDSDAKPAPVEFEPEYRLDWRPGAEKIFGELANMPIDEPDGMRRNLLGRIAENAIRVAQCVAFCRGTLIIDELDMMWARKLVLQSFEFLHQGVLENLEDPHSLFALYKLIPKMMREREGGWISHRDLTRETVSFTKKGDDLDEALKKLEAAEIIRHATRPPGPKGGRPSPGYELINSEENS